MPPVTKCELADVQKWNHVFCRQRRAFELHVVCSGWKPMETSFENRKVVQKPTDLLKIDGKS
jgi:hypothetical protein